MTNGYDASGILVGRVALVTGAMGSVGGAIARGLSAAGADVIAADISCGQAGAAVIEGGASFAIELDQRSPVSITQCATRVAERYGRLDILVNCAAASVRIPFPDLEALTPDIWDQLLETNVRGPFLLARALAPLLKADGGGHIVNISSLGGVAPMGSSIAYAVSKAGLNHLTSCLAVALAPQVLVNCISPGVVENTRMSNLMMDADAQKAARSRTLLGHMVHVEDLVRQVLSFAMSSSVTGETISIDSGLAAALLAHGFRDMTKPQ